ncbi:ATP synthase F0 subunit C [Bdellovibrio sp. HCB337]|uniref:ATP synthase F0 subunit C n=1 Tax=Bdellovibrio sp. HCB337 TaxID=3394358 RepID=UPI0039A46EDF
MKNFSTKLMVTLAATMVAAPAFAQEAAAGGSTSDKGIVALAAALAIGIAAFGGAMAQGKAAAAALDGISRNPAASGKIMTPMIIGLALIESLVIYALVIAFKIS